MARAFSAVSIRRFCRGRINRLKTGQSLSNFSRLWDRGTIPSCLAPGHGAIRADNQWPRVQELDKGVLGGMGFGLITLHVKGIFSGKSFPTSKKWPALGRPVPPRSTKFQAAKPQNKKIKHMANTVRKTRTSEAGQNASYREASSVLAHKCQGVPQEHGFCTHLPLIQVPSCYTTAFTPTGSIPAKKKVELVTRIPGGKALQTEGAPGAKSLLRELT